MIYKNLLQSEYKFPLIFVLLIFLLSPQHLESEPLVNPQLRFLQDTSHNRLSESAKSNPGHKQSSQEIYLPLIVALTTPDAELPEGVYEWRRRGNIALVTIAYSDLYKLNDWEYVSRIEASRAHTPSMNLALDWCAMPSFKQHTADQGLSLTGEGVVVGFSDIGFDPHHINFIAPDGIPRVKKLVYSGLGNPYPFVCHTDDAIRNWITDTPTQTHATHVAGILAGSYDNNGVIGVATQADIVASTSDLYDAYILDGIEQVLDYARSQGKPAVVNLSVSSAIGPHDGTTLFNEYISQLAEELPICISAGNDGNRPANIFHTFTDDTPLRFYPIDWPSWIRNYASGAVDIWTDHPEDLQVNIVEIDNKTHQITRRWSATGLNDFQSFAICSPEYKDMFAEMQTESLPTQFYGYFYAASEINPRNNRYNVLVDLSYSDEVSTYPVDPASNIGIELIGKPGTKVEVYSTSNIYLNKNYDSCGLTGTSYNAINDFCMKGNVICVGSFNTRDFIPHLDYASTPRPGNAIGEISYFSSSGLKADGTPLPDVVAPGAIIVSSFSTPYVDEYPDLAASALASKATVDGNTYYWGSDQGTSMSSPYTAGTIALWLERYPELTSATIRKILRETSLVPEGASDVSHWGAGILNILKGYELAGKLSGIDNIPPADRNVPTIKITRDGAYITYEGETVPAAHFFSVDGSAIPQAIFAEVASGILYADFNTLHSGLYILEVSGCQPVKIAIR